MSAAQIVESNRAALRPTASNAPAELMDERTLDRHRADLMSLRRYRNSKSSFKLTLDVPPSLGFVALPAVLLESLVWGSLGVYERRLIDFLLVEHLRHGRTQNGYLKATFDQLEAHRIPRRFIARVIEKLVELRLIEVVRRGGHAGGARQNPSLYR